MPRAQREGGGCAGQAEALLLSARQDDAWREFVPRPQDAGFIPGPALHVGASYNTVSYSYNTDLSSLLASVLPGLTATGALSPAMRAAAARPALWLLWGAAAWERAVQRCRVPSCLATTTQHPCPATAVAGRTQPAGHSTGRMLAAPSTQRHHGAGGPARVGAAAQRHAHGPARPACPSSHGGRSMNGMYATARTCKIRRKIIFDGEAHSDGRRPAAWGDQVPQLSSELPHSQLHCTHTHRHAGTGIAMRLRLAQPPSRVAAPSILLGLLAALAVLLAGHVSSAASADTLLGPLFCVSPIQGLGTYARWPNDCLVPRRSLIALPQALQQHGHGPSPAVAAAASHGAPSKDCPPGDPSVAPAAAADLASPFQPEGYELPQVRPVPHLPAADASLARAAPNLPVPINLARRCARSITPSTPPSSITSAPGLCGASPRQTWTPAPRWPRPASTSAWGAL